MGRQMRKKNLSLHQIPISMQVKFQFPSAVNICTFYASRDLYTYESNIYSQYVYICIIVNVHVYIGGLRARAFPSQSLFVRALSPFATETNHVLTLFTCVPINHYNQTILYIHIPCSHPLSLALHKLGFPQLFIYLFYYFQELGFPSIIFPDQFWLIMAHVL